MTLKQAVRSLEELRREIDGIDDAIHDLIMRRAALLAEIATAKGSGAGTPGAYLRPGREALVLRRLLARHRGPFPKPAMVRLWREIISAPLALQGAFSVAVLAAKVEPGYWDLARDHYGSTASFIAHETPGQVIRALGEGRVVVGVLPAIREEERDPWWVLLAREDERSPQIIARLPMAGSANARGEGLQALVVGPALVEATGHDRSYVVFEVGEELSRAGLRSQLDKAGLLPAFLAVWTEAGGGRRLVLVELSEFVAKDDPRLDAFADAMAGRVRRRFHLGGYALPFELGELAPEPPASA